MIVDCPQMSTFSWSSQLGKNWYSKFKLQDIDISTQYQAKLDGYNKLAEEIKDEGISQEVIEKVERKADRTKPPQKEATDRI